MKASHKLFAALFVATILVLGVGLYATSASENALRDAIEHDSAARSAAVMDEIDRIMELRIGQWIAYAGGELVQRSLRASNDRFQRIANVQDLIDDRDREWRSVPEGELSPLMRQLMDNSLSRDLRVRLGALRNDEGVPVLAEAFVTNRFGANVSQTNRTSDYRQDDEDWWQAAVRDGLYIGDVDFDVSAGVYSTDICVRIDDDSGTLAGVLKVVLNIQPVIEIIDSRVAWEATENRPTLVLLTSDHRIIHRGDADDSPLEDGSKYFSGVTIHPDSTVFTTTRIDTDSGEDRLSAFAVSQGHADYPGLGWILLLEYDARRALEPASALQREIIVFSILAATILLGIGWPLALSMTREVANRRRAEKRAQAANRAKGEFLANMSHEIRTPMSGMLGMTSLLLEEELSADQRDYAETIQSCGENLLAIINDILDFSKIEERRFQIEPVSFELQQVVSEVIELLLRHAREKGVELIPRFAPGTPRRTVGDPGRIRQILMNLIGNAVKFTPQGHVLIEVENLAEDERGAQIRFSIHDTGIGIPEEDQQKLFEPFSQVDTSAARWFRGTGLGLAISKRLTELMDGSIGVESSPGQGSSFWFTLRLARSRETAPEAPLETCLSGQRILLVDGHTIRRRVLREQLESWRMDVVEETSVAQGLAELRDAAAAGHPFRVAILKLPMSRAHVDRAGFARCVRADPELCDTLLVLITPNPEKGEARQAQELGFAAYLVDPVRATLLRDCLTTVLNEQSSGEERREIVTHRTIAEARALSSSATAGTEPAGREGPPIHSHVLVIEDDPANQKIVRLLLERLGCSVDLAANGVEGVKMARSGSYDLIFMDCQMPEMDGYEATALLRRHERGGNVRVPIIALTANVMQGDRERCLEAGMDDYLAKPISRRALEKMVRQWSSV